MESNQTVEILVKLKNLLSRPAKEVVSDIANVASAAESAARALAQTQSQLNKIEGFKKLKKEIVESEAAFKNASIHVGTLAREIKEIDVPTKKMTSDFEKAKIEARGLKEVFLQKQIALHKLRTELNASGIKTKELSLHERELKAEVVRLNGVLKQEDVDLGKVNTGIKKVGASAINAGNQVQSFGHKTKASVSGVDKLITGLGAKIASLGLGFAAFRFGKASITSAADFEEALADMVKVTDQSFESIKKSILSIDPALGSATELVRGYYQVISAGVAEPVKAIETLKVASKLAKTAHTDQGEVVKGLTSVMDAFGASANESADAMQTIEKAGKTTVEELVPVIGEVSAASKALGVDLNSMGAGFASITKFSGGTEKAATQFRALLVSLLNPTKELTELLKEYGGAQAAIKKIGLEGVMKLIADSTKGNAEALKTMLGPTEAYLGFLGLTNNEMKSYQINMASMKEKTGALDRAWIEYEKTLKSIRSTLKNVIAQIFIDGTASESIKQVLTDLTNWVIQNKELLIKDLKRLFDVIITTVKLLWQFKEVLIAVGGTFVAVTMIKALAGTVVALNAALTWTVLTGLPGVITGFKGLRLATLAAASGVGALNLAFKAFIVFAAVEGIINIVQLGKEIWLLRDALKGAKDAQKNYADLLQRNIDKFKNFAHIIPKDITKATQKELEELNLLLIKSRTYWQALRDQAKLTPGNEAKIKDYQEVINKINEKLKAVKEIRFPVKAVVTDVDVTATPKVKIPEVKIPELSLMESSLSRMKASNDLHLKELEALYDKGLVSLGKYYSDRIAMTLAQQQKEIELIKKAITLESDPIKRLKLEDDLFVLRKRHAEDLLVINQNHIKVLTDLEKEKADFIIKAQEANKKESEDKLQVKQITTNITSRSQEGEGGFLGLKSGFEKDRAEMDARHSDELKDLQDLATDKMAIEMGYINELALLQDVARQQKLEKDKLLHAQEQQLMQAKMQMASDTAGNISSFFNDMYELTGRKQKEFFIISKAASIAQATIATYKSATEAYSAMAGIPYVGPVLGAIAAGAAIAAGMANVANIKSQSMAKGGLVLGSSPTPTSDNIPINATANEFMQPVSSVKKYGVGVMEGIRQGLYPTEIFEGYKTPYIPPSLPRYNYAAGGTIRTPRDSGEGRGGKSNEKITIINLHDDTLLEQWGSSASGDRTFINQFSRNAYQVKQMLMAEG